MGTAVFSDLTEDVSKIRGLPCCVCACVDCMMSARCEFVGKEQLLPETVDKDCAPVVPNDIHHRIQCGQPPEKLVRFLVVVQLLG